MVVVSIRELPKYDVDVHTEHIDIKARTQQNDILALCVYWLYNINPIVILTM
jgi:hypothetical protein